MNTLKYLIIVLAVSTTPLFAQGMMGNKGDMPGMGSNMRPGMQMNAHYDMYTRMLNHTIMMARTLDLTEKQNGELTGIQEKYLYPAVKKGADFRISHMKIMTMVHDPNFDRETLKAEIKVANDLSLQMANSFVDGLAEVRKTIGMDNYKKIMGPMPVRNMDSSMDQDVTMKDNGSGSDQYQGSDNSN